jgi:hypothetical protein
VGGCLFVFWDPDYLYVFVHSSNGLLKYHSCIYTFCRIGKKMVNELAFPEDILRKFIDSVESPKKENTDPRKMQSF